MTITAKNAGPHTLIKIASVYEGHGQWFDAAGAWNNAAILTAAWNPALAREYDKHAQRCLDLHDMNGA